MSTSSLSVIVVVTVGFLWLSQAFEPLRYTHVTVARPLSQRGNNYSRRKQKLTPRGEDSMQPPLLHHLNVANGSNNGDSSSSNNDRRRSSKYNNQVGSEDHDRIGVMNRLDFGFEVGAAGAALLLRAMSREASADEGTSVASGGGDSPPVTIEAAARTAPKSSLRDLGFEVPYAGKSFPLSKFLGSKATLVVNPKIDDPESLNQMPGITKLAADYGNQGLNVLLFPTDQGTFEADEDRVVRIKFYQFYGFGQYPKAVVFDKVDIVGNTIHPFYRYLCRGLKNPNGIARITLNYEKFLLDKDGTVLRRYPRKLEAADFEQDIQAVLAEQPPPAETRDYKLSWLKAEQEASKSEYAFKLGLNYYNN